MGGLLSDFWWLDQNQLDKFTYLELGHSEPVDDLTRPTIQAQKCQMATIDEFRSKYYNTNIYRSLMLWDTSMDGRGILGPFLVDIDNENDLNASHTIVKQLLNYFINDIGLIIDNIRILFTGHKGFNIEIRPKVLNIYGSISDQVGLSHKILDKIRDDLRKYNKVQNMTLDVVDNKGTIIDLTYGGKYSVELKHPYIRLHDSINSWLGNNGETKSRRKIELSYQDLFEISIEEILLKSEKEH